MTPHRRDDREQVRAAVGARYAGLARAAEAGQQVSDCGPPGCASGGFGPAAYPDADGVPEGFRVLRPGGRLGVTDILAEDHLTLAQRLERGTQAGCIAGAPSFAEYRGGLAAAGFTAITITVTHRVADGLHSAIIRAAVLIECRSAVL